MQDALMAFLNPNNDNITIEDINKKSRIILLASEFDDALLAMGEWLDTQGVAFKCIGYEIYKIEEQKYLSFSVLFDKSKDSLYRLRSNEIINTNREPAIFFHNIGTDWEAIHKKGMIPCGFDGQLNDRGTQIMRNYVEGDTIIAYQSRTGILGYGVITEPAKGNFDDSDDKNNHYEQKGGYRLYERDSPIGSPHTLKIEWKYILSEKTAIKTGEFEEKFKIYHPIQTSSKIRLQDKAKELLELIEEKSEKIHM